MVALNGMTLKTFAQLSPIYYQPLFSLLDHSRRVHSQHWGEKEGVQLCRLLSIKTGGCSEDCGYCAQSARYNTGVKAERLMVNRRELRKCIGYHSVEGNYGKRVAEAGA